MKSRIQRIGFNTRISRLLLLVCQCMNFYGGRNKMTVLPNVSYWSRFVLWWIQFFPELKMALKERRFNDHHNSSKITGCTFRVSNNALPRMFWMVAQLRGSLYAMPRKLLQRGQYWLEGKCCCFEGINSARKLPTPHTFPTFMTCNSYTQMYNSTLPYVHAYMQTKIAHTCLCVPWVNVHTAASVYPE